MKSTVQNCFSGVPPGARKLGDGLSAVVYPGPFGRGLLLALLLSFPSYAAVEMPPHTVTKPDFPGYAGADASFTPSLSPDGRWIVFVSLANNLVSNDDLQPFLDVFVRDLDRQTTALVSVSRTGRGGGDGNSSFPTLSSGGRFVAFASDAANLVTNDTNAASDVFVRDLVANTTSLVSVNTNSAASPNGASTFPLISANGQWVIFESTATDLVTNITSRTNDVFARDLQSDTTTLVSVSPLGTGGHGPSSLADMTPDARFVAFVSKAGNLFPWGTNAFGPLTNVPGDIFVRDLQTATTHWASRDVTNFIAPPVSCFNAVLSADGRYVAFKAARTITPPGPVYVFRHDLQTSNTLVLATNSLGNTAPAISADGRFVAFDDVTASTNTHVFRWDAQTGSNALVSVGADGVTPGDGDAHTPVMTLDGKQVAFLFALRTNVANPVRLTFNTVNDQFQVYLRDLDSGTTLLVSSDRLGFGSSDDLEFTIPALSDNGSRVAFETANSGITTSDFNGVADVFAFTVSNGTRELVSRAAPGLTAATAAGLAYLGPNSVSADGKRIVFASLDGNLVPESNGLMDIFVRDFNWRLSWLSRTNTVPANSLSREPVISADGRLVAFVNLDAFTNRSDVYVSDVNAQTGRLASVNWTGTNRANGNSSAPLLSGDGRLLAFQSDGTDLVAGLSEGNSGSDVFVRDLVAGTNLLVSVNLAGTGSGNATSAIPVLSRDGRRMLFRSRATDLVTNSVNGSAIQLFVRDLTAQQCLLVSQDTNGGGFTSSIMTAGFSPDGQKILYSLASGAIYVYDVSAGTHDLVHPMGFSPSYSADARWVVFLVGGSGVNYRNVWLKDQATGVTRVISTNRLDFPLPPEANPPLISHDGRYVIYTSTATNLVDHDANGAVDIFVYDTVAATTLLVSQNLQGTGSGNGLSTRPILGADGRSVLFQSFASDLVAGDFNNQSDLFILRLTARDTDGDGLDDDWEMAYFNTLDPDGRGDWDGDGQSDKQEFRAGTDPTNGGSVLRVLTVTSPGTGNTTVLWSAVPGRTYRVQFKDEVDGALWTDLPGTVNATTSTGVKVDPAAGTQSQRFYRVVLVP